MYQIYCIANVYIGSATKGLGRYELTVLESSSMESNVASAMYVQDRRLLRQSWQDRSSRVHFRLPLRQLEHAYRPESPCQPSWPYDSDGMVQGKRCVSSGTEVKWMYSTPRRLGARAPVPPEIDGPWAALYKPLSPGRLFQQLKWRQLLPGSVVLMALSRLVM